MIVSEQDLVHGFARGNVKTRNTSLEGSRREGGRCYTSQETPGSGWKSTPSQETSVFSKNTFGTSSMSQNHGDMNCIQDLNYEQPKRRAHGSSNERRESLLIDVYEISTKQITSESQGSLCSQYENLPPLYESAKIDINPQTSLQQARLDTHIEEKGHEKDERPYAGVSIRKIRQDLHGRAELLERCNSQPSRDKHTGTISTIFKDHENTAGFMNVQVPTKVSPKSTSHQVHRLNERSSTDIIATNNRLRGQES